MSPLRCCFLFLFACLAMAADINELDQVEIRKNAEALLAIPDRAAGSPGAEAAAHLIETELKSFGLKPILVPIAVAAPIDRGSILEVAGKRIALTPHRCNKVATAGTGGKALTGKLLFAGRGNYGDFNGQDVTGRIVVLDADSRDSWCRAAALGASAVIYSGTKGMDGAQVLDQGVTASVEFPRFVADLDKTLNGQEATLTSTVAWEPRTAYSVAALIPGTGKHEDAVILAAGYESPSTLLGLCPGATRAWNAGLLLEAARQLALAPPERNTLVIFHGDRAEFMRGLRSIVCAFAYERTAEGKYDKTSMLDALHRDALLRVWQIERVRAAYAQIRKGTPNLAALLAALKSLPTDDFPAGVLDDGDKVGKAQIEPTVKLAKQLVLQEAADVADQLQIPLEAKRLAFSRRKTDSLSQTRIDELLAQIGQEEIPYQSYRTVQQKLEFVAEMNAEEDSLFPELVEKAAEDCERHLRIVQAQLRDIEGLLKIRALDCGAPIHLIGFDLSDGNDRFSTVTSGGLVTWANDLAWLNKLLKNTAEKFPGLSYDRSSHELQADESSYFPTSYQHEAGIAGVLVPAATIATTNDLRSRLGSPLDNAANFDATRFLRQTVKLSPFLRAYIDSPELSSHKGKPLVCRSPWVQVQCRSVGGKSTTRSFPYPLTVLRWGMPEELPSFSGEVGMRETVFGDSLGKVPFLFLPQRHPDLKQWQIETYGVDANGRITSAQNGNVAWDAKWAEIGDLLANVFTADGSRLFDILDPRLMVVLDSVRPLSATREAPPQFAHVELDANQGVAAIFTEPNRPLRITATQGQIGNRLVLLGKTAKDQSPDEHTSNSRWSRFYGVVFAASLAAACAAAAWWLSRRKARRRIGFAAVATIALCLPMIFGAIGIYRNRAVPAPSPIAKVAAGEVGIEPGRLARQTALDVASDLWHLNDQRLRKLRANGINSDSLVTLHSRAERQLKRAEEEFAAERYDTSVGAAHAAWAYAGRVYPSVLGTANDVVYGLVVMLLFAIPFALVCERLFISGNTVGKKVAGFSFFFVLVFLFFLFFHPAFSIAATPMFIFLAFVILITSIWVIALIFNRFENEMEIIRMANMGVHTADVSRLGTLFATVALGISNMRRRPIRTFLTGITVVLMTFILLTFASFNPSVGSQRIGLDSTSPYSGILVRQNGWKAINEDALERVRATWGPSMSISVVRWLAPTPQMMKVPLDGPAGSSFLSGMAGFSTGDPSRIEDSLYRGPIAAATPRGFGDETDWLFLPTAIQKRTGLEAGKTAQFRGRSVRIGTIDTARFSASPYLGNESILPLTADAIDTAHQRELDRGTAQAAEGSPQMESMSFTHLGSGSVGIMHESMLALLGGDLRAIALAPKNDQVDLDTVADDIAQQSAMTLRVGNHGDTYLLTGVSKLSVAGLGSVLIPLILGGLIIFSTMLNSVAERGKEIFIYASLGLAPLHVAALFLVEASIYSILGGLGGYIVAQLLVSGLGLAADFGIGVQPDLNYSSFTAVTTILLVMATVLLSALYPALVASKAASPGRSDFRLPKPEGDSLSIDFPFTVAARDIRGLLAYLANYFSAHTEASTACFTAADPTLHAEPDRKLFTVAAKIWLAPFDLGISQKLTISANPTDVKAIYSVQMKLELLSGQRSSWRRANIAFLKALRQQFLVWRTLSQRTMDHYRSLGGDEEARERLLAASAEEAEPKKPDTALFAKDNV